MAHAHSKVLWSVFFMFAVGFCVTVSQKQNNSLLAQAGILSPERAMYSQLVVPASGPQLPSIPIPAQTSSALPDYAVQSLFVAPAVPEAGEEVSFHGKVVNVGQTRGSHRDFVQLQIDEGNNGTWDYTSSLDIVSGIPVGSSTNVQWGTTGIPPPIAWPRRAGTHVMKVCLHIPSSIDTDEYLADANASNDCATLVFQTIALPTASSSSSISSHAAASQSSSTVAIPDFSLEDLRFFQDATGYAMTVVVKNSGASTSKWAHVRLDIDGIRGVMTYGIKPLSTNATDTAVWSSSVLPPKNGWIGTEGYHTAVACIDNENGDPADSNAGNNCKQITFAMKAAQASSASSASSVATSRSSSSAVSSSSRSSSPSSQASVSSATSGLPDHTISAMNVVPSGTVGRINAWGIVKNQGLGDSQNYSYAVLEYRRQGTTAWTRIMQTRYISALHPGEEEEADWPNFADVTGLPYASGTYEFHVCADVWDSLLETSNANNCYPPMTVIIPQSTTTSSASSRSSSTQSSVSSTASSRSASSISSSRFSASSVSSSRSSATSSISSSVSSRSSAESSISSSRSSSISAATACLSSAALRRQAAVFCQGHCSRASGKCGVNSFSVGASCTATTFRSATWTCYDGVRGSPSGRSTSASSRSFSSISSSAPSSAAASSSSSSSSASAFKGVCVVRDNQTSTPAYTAPDAGRGYVKEGQGTNFTVTHAVIDACSNTVFDPLIRTFCQRNPGSSYQTLVALYDQANNLQSPPVYMNQNFISCPAASSSSSSRQSTQSSSASAAAGLPDLYLREFSMSDGMHFSYTLDNLGTVTVPPYTAEMRFEWIDTAGVAHLLFGSTGSRTLVPGNAPYPHILTVSSQLIPAQAVRLRATVDQVNSIPESDETNNMRETSIVR